VTYGKHDIEPTELERGVLNAVRLGDDPWKMVRHKSIRVHSQALSRLQKKGLVTKSHEHLGEWVLTAEGKKWLRVERAAFAKVEHHESRGKYGP
jgi:DNA-binding PadR family transcriptional regulator